MTKEPEPRATGQGSNPLFSPEDQLNAFRARLDREKIGATKIIPGFLFRNGRERRVVYTRQFTDFPSSARWLYVDGLHYEPAPEIDDDLLERHTETYRKGLEARDQLLDRINATQILGMVRDVWGRGEIQQKGREVLLSCNYAFATEEIKASTIPGHYVSGSAINGDFYVGTSTSYEITGKWFASSLRAKEEIRVDFGNMQFPDPEKLPGNEKCPYKLYASKDAELREFFLDFYQGRMVTQHIDYNPVPKEIWTKPDNLVIRVTVPYSMQPIRVVGGYKSDNKGFVWFDQSASQQDIMDYLAEKLEAQRKVGQLPSQVEALELAKIEELKKRGLLLEPAE